MPDPSISPRGIEATALGVANSRARESRRDNPLFRDPLAELVVRRQAEGAFALPEAWQNARLRALYGDYIALRTCFVDAQLRQALDAGVRQVVLLASGLDGRAFRMSWPTGARLFELDRGEIVRFKAEIVSAGRLEPKVALTEVAGDLIRDDFLSALQVAGLDPDQPVAWVLEGILGYLEKEQADAVVEKISAAAVSGSRLVAVYVHGLPADGILQLDGADDASTKALFQLFKKGPDAEPQAWLSGRGWIVDATTIETWAAKLGRPVPPIMDAANGGVRCHCVAASR